MTTGAAVVDGARHATSATHRFSLVAWLPMLTAAAVFAVAAALVPPYAVGIFHDDGVYLILAKALATGQGYHDLHLSGLPFDAHYPPAYPAFLSLLWRMQPAFPENIGFLLLGQAALLGVVAWGVHRFCTRSLGTGPYAASIAALVGALSLPLMTLSSALFSEVLFLALLFPLLVVAERALRDGAGLGRVAALGLASGLLGLLRVQALSVGVGVLVLYAMRRDWRRAGVFAAAMVVALLPWQAWTAVHARPLPRGLSGAYGSYLGWYLQGLAVHPVWLVFGSLAVNVKEIGALLADRFSLLATPLVRAASALAAAAFILLGGVALRKRVPVTIAFAVVYAGVVLALPYPPWRYLWGVWPLVIILAAAGGWTAMRFVAERAAAARTIVVAALALVAGGAVRAEGAAYVHREWSEPARRATVTVAPMVAWVNANTRRDDLILGDDEPLLYLFTGRQAMPPRMFTASEYLRPEPREQAASALAEMLRRYPVRYVVTVVPSTAELLRSMPNVRESRDFGTGAAFEVLRP